ncbi:MAG: ABC transporter ATP-binding protein [Gammaproteobacteria bacterium]
MTSAIRVDSLCKTFPRYRTGGRPRSLREWLAGGARRLEDAGRIEALTDINFELNAGDVLGVIGRNGAGKSTLLTLVGGVGSPDTGMIERHGRIGALLELGAGGHPNLTGRDNVLISGVIAGLSKKQVLEKMTDIVRFAELEAFVDSPLRTYSTGMQMRLAFSVVVHADPKILLVDEVLSVGDIAFQQKCVSRIQYLRDNGCIVILATHDLQQAVEICDRVLWLDEGRQRSLGDPSQVVDEFRNQASVETAARTPLPDPTDTTGMQSELVLRDNRLGSQEVRITGVYISDLEGNTAKAIAAGQPARLVLEYEAKKPVDGAIFGVSISTEDGRVCLEVSTAHASVEQHALGGKGAVVLELFQLELRPGSYFVDVGIYEREWRYAYDYHWHVYPIEIKPTETKMGHRSVPHRWSVKE